MKLCNHKNLKSGCIECLGEALWVKRKERGKFIRAFYWIYDKIIGWALWRWADRIK